MIFGQKVEMGRNKMSIKPIVDVMAALITEHQALVVIANEKTDVIKNSDMDALSKILIKERKQAQAISQLEDKRQLAVKAFFQTQQVVDREQTVQHLLEVIKNEEEKKQLEEVISELIEEIISLKQIEQLNQELIEQSMAFVQLSLDMLQPSVKNMNYKATNKQHQIQQTSVFDSKA